MIIHITVSNNPKIKDDLAMTTARFNPIIYQNKLREAGLEARIAEIHAEEMQTVLNSDVATKHDIQLIRQEICNTEHKMVIKLGSLVVGCTFIISMIIGIMGFIAK